MTTMDLPYKSLLHQQYNEEGRKQGLEQGLEQGIEQGLERGVINVLWARGFVVSEELKARIRQLTDPAELDALQMRAVTVDSPENLFQG